MRLAVLRGPHTLELTDAPIPAIEPDEVLVRVVACGVCTSELDVWEGHADLNRLILPYPLEGRPQDQLHAIALDYYPKFLDMIGAKR